MSGPTARPQQSWPTGARVVVGTDGSDAAGSAVAAALAEAALRGITVEVVAAWDVPTASATDPAEAERVLADAEAQAERAARRQLAELVGPAPGGAVPTTVRAVRGSPAGVLISAAADAQLLVVGSQGRGGLSRVLFGSVTTACIAGSVAPVLVIPPDGWPARPRGLVVVGVDAEQPELAAVRVAAREAALRGAKLRIVACWQAIGTWLLPAEALAVVRESQPWHIRQVTDRACECARDLVPEGAIETRIAEGHASHLLTSSTDEADLVVLSNRRLPLWRRAIEPSTSQHVAHHAHGPVLVVPAMSDA